MGCGCKTINSEPISGSTTEKKKFSFDKDEINENISNFLLKEKKFSLIGLFIFLITYPIIAVLIFPIVGIIFFNKMVFGKNTNLVGLITFKKNKKTKK